MAVNYRGKKFYNIGPRSTKALPSLEFLLAMKNAEKILEATDTKGRTALHVACQHQNTAAVKILLQKGAAVTGMSDDGLIPIHVSAQVPML